MLFLRKQYFAAIRAGSKTTTIRFWRYAMVRPGSEEKVPGLGRLRIEGVEEIALESLTAADARADGFATLRALKAALAEHYPQPAREGKKLYRVRFTFLA